jgi:hypothetical protein
MPAPGSEVEEYFGTQSPQACLAHHHLPRRHEQVAAIALCRVRVAPIRGEARFAEETLLIELPKLRWRIERDYHDLKQENEGASIYDVETTLNALEIDEERTP